MDLYPVVICLDRGKKAGKFLRCGESGTFYFYIFWELLAGLVLFVCFFGFFLNVSLINLFILYFFIFGCVGSSFLCEGFLQLRQVGATLHRGARASHCRGLSHCGAQAPDAQAQ